MKTQRILLVAALSCAATLFAAPPAAPAARVEVIFEQPEKYTDVKDSFMGTEKGRDGYLAELKTHLQERALRRLGPGQTLTFTFTNIDLAGDFEPGRGPSSDDIRIVKDIYPPRLNFSYKLVDESGAVLKEGQEKLTDLGFQSSASPINNGDSLRYEKALLDNWLRDKIQLPKAASHKK